MKATKNFVGDLAYSKDILLQLVTVKRKKTNDVAIRPGTEKAIGTRSKLERYTLCPQESCGSKRLA